MKQTDCLFCKLAKNKKLEEERKLYMNQHLYTILSANPQTLGHTLVIPKQHYSSLVDLPKELVGLLLQKAIEIGELEKEKIGAKAYVIKVNDNLYSLEGVETGHMEHVHVHVIPRYYSNEKLPEHPQKASPKELFDVKKKICS